jgi:hypothetical protein
MASIKYIPCLCSPCPQVTLTTMGVWLDVPQDAATPATVHSAVDSYKALVNLLLAQCAPVSCRLGSCMQAGSCM